MRGQAHRWLGLVALALLAVVLVRCAWVSDDAFITLRTVDNALHGLGLRWNPAERVQSYTHPLWMLGLLVAHALSGGPYYGTLVLGGVTTLAAVAVLWYGVARSTGGALIGVTALFWSKAFVDFGTSGLENPLTHLLLAVFAWSLFQGGDRPADLFRTALLTALAMLNRLDLAVLFAPGLLIHATSVARTRRHIAALAAGFAPLFAWEAFSFVYYGSLVPNTAYAKLGTGIPRGEMLVQGVRYLQHAAMHDRVTVLALFLGVVPLVRLRHPPAVAVGLGGLAYLAYVVWIGGDFMAGRFLTPPLFAAALGLAMLEPGPAIAAAGVLGMTLLGAASPYAPAWSGATYERIAAWEGIVDERGYYHRGAGLLASKRPISHAFAREGRQARKLGPHTEVRAAVGYFGYYAGPKVHIVDPLGLNDPLVARMPARYNPGWRVGHYRRELPFAYDPGNDIPPQDPDLAGLYARVRRVTRGPLLDPGRLGEALSLQVFGPGIDPWPWRFPGVDVRDEGGVVQGVIGEHGRVVHVDPPRPVEPVLRAARGERIRVLYGRGRRILATHDLVATGEDQAVPGSPGAAELVFVFPLDRNAKIHLGRLALGP
ncbi:MAG: hypothetical protein H6737_26530 [Alphaproteobacteria bacterium]|nr:hypothetical protein [Alphaproteobacteria bacterium]